MSNRQVKINLLFDANTAAAQANIQQLSNLLTQISSTRTTIGINNGNIQQAVVAAQQLQTALANAVNVDTGKIDLIKLQTQLKSSGTSVQTLASQLRAVGPAGEQAFLKVAMAVSQAQVPMAKANGLIANFMTTLANTAKWQIASSAIHGVMGMFQSATSHAKNLNKALTDIQIVTHANTSEMAVFAKKATEAANALNTTSTEYAKAALIFYQQGLNDSDVAERTDTVIKLAQVTGESAEIVSDQMTAIWNNFDEGANSLEYYADVLTKLGAITAASTDEIAAGLEKFAAIAGTVGMEYETAAAAIATVVAETRQSADVVGTAFKTIFARVQGLSLGETLEDGVDLNKYSSALATIGVDILNSNGELREMDDILNDLGEKWQYLGNETQVALAQVVGGTRQYAQLIALMDNWDKVTENINEAKNATGELAVQQKIWSQSYEGSLKSLEQAKKELYETFISDDLLIGWNDAMAMLTKSVSSLVKHMGGAGPFLMSIVGMFSKTLFPLISTGLTKLSNLVSVSTGKAARDVAAMQAEMSASLNNMMNNAGFTEGMKKQLALTQQMLQEKQKLMLASKTMTEAQKVEAQSRLAVAESIAAETMQILQQQDALEKQARALKESMTAGSTKWTVARASVENSFRQKSDAQAGPNESEQDKFDRQARDNWVLERAANTGAGKLTSQIDAGTQFLENQKQLQQMAPTVAKANAQAEAHEAISPEDLSIRDKARNLQEEQAKLLEKMGISHGDINADVSQYVENLIKARDVQKEIHGIVNDTKGSGVAGAAVGTAKVTKDTSDSMYEEGTDIQAVRMNQMQNLSKSTQGALSVSTSTDGSDSTLSMDASLESYDQLYQALAEQKILQGELASAMQEVKFIQDEKKAADDAVTASTKELSSAEKELSGAYATLIASGQKIPKNVSSQSKAFSKLTKEQQNYIKAQERVNKATSQNQKALNNQEKVLKNLPKNIKKSQTAYQDLAQKAGATGEQMKRLETAFNNLDGESADIDGEMKNIAAVFKELGIASDGVAGDLIELGNNMAVLLAKAGYSDEEIEQLTLAFTELANKAPQANNGLNGTKGALDGLNSKVPTAMSSLNSMAQNAMTLAGNLMSLKSGVEGLASAFMSGGTAAEKMQGVLTGIMGIMPTIIMITNAFKASQDKSNKSTMEGVGADLAKTASGKVKTAGTWADTLANIANLLSNPWTMVIAAIAIAAIAGVCAWLSSKTEKTKEDTKANLENAQSQMESIDTTQKLAKEVKALTEEYDKLSKAGKNTSDVLNDMNEKVPELIQSYKDLAKEMQGTNKTTLSNAAEELEHLYNVAKLTGDYSAFEAKQKEIDQTIARVEYNNAKVGGKDAGYLGAEAMQAATSGSINTATGKATLNLDGSDNSRGKGFWSWLGIGATESEYGVGNDENTALNKRTDEEKVAKSILKNNVAKDDITGGWSAGMFAKEQINIELDYTNPGQFVEQYEALQEARTEMETLMSEAQLNDSDIYRELKDALAAGKEQYENMLPMAEAQRDAGGKLAEAFLESGGTLEDGTVIGAMSMENIDTMEEYLQYRANFVAVATKEYGLTEAQAEMYLKEAESLDAVATEYALAEEMLTNFTGMTEEQMKSLKNSPEAFAAYNAELQNILTDAFGELDENEMKIAVSIAATADSFDDFAEQMQLALIASARQGFETSATVAGDAMKAAVENGSFDFSNLFSDDNFIEHMETIGVTQAEILSSSYEEQYRIVSEFYSKVSADAYDTYNQETDILTYQLAKRQREMAAYHTAMKDLEKKDDVLAEQEAYAKKQEELATAETETKKAEIQKQINAMEDAFKEEYGFEITSNAQTIQNEIDELIASMDELQDKKIEIAMNWDGVDQVEAGMKKAAEFAKVVAKDTKKVGNQYVMTAAQAREWLEFYPELGAIAETTTDGLIQMDADKLDELIANNDAQLDSSIDTQIAELEAQKTALKAELDAKLLEQEAAEKLKQGEMERENISAQYLVNLRKNLTDYFIEQGYDEQQAQVLALQSMQMNEETYAARVAELADQQATDIGEAAEAGANAQVDSLKQLGQRWSSFASFLVNNIGTVLYDIGCALLDPTRSVSDVFKGYWDNTAISVSANTGSKDKYDYSMDSDYQLSEAERKAAFEGIADLQYDSVTAEVEALKNGLNSLDGKIDYLKALKNQDLSDYGSTDPDDDSSGSDDKSVEEMVDNAERYHEITKEIEAMEKALDRLAEKKERAFGAEKLALMEEEIALSEDLLQKQSDLLDAQTVFLASDLQNIQNNFSTRAKTDQYGNLSNYSDLVAEAEAEFNAAKKVFNESAQEDADQDVLDAAEALYEKKIGLLEQYEDTLSAHQDQVAAVEAEMYKLQEKKFAQLNYKLEFEVDLNDKELERIDYYLNKISEDVYATAEAFGYLSRQTELYTANLAAQDAYLTELQANYEAGTISAADYKDGLEESQSSVISYLQALEEQKKAMQDYYGNVMDMALEKIALYTNEMEQLNTVLDHYTNINELIGKQDDYATKNKILSSKANNLQNEMKVQQKLYEKSAIEAEKWAEKMATATEGSNEYETYKKNWQAAQLAANEAQDAMLTKTEEWAAAMKSIIENELAELANTLEESLTGGVSFDELLTSMERRSSLQEEYLTTTNQIYETNKMMRAAQQEIDKTSNTVAKKKLQSFINETNQLQNQTKLSQYELDIQQAKYDLLLAEIALQEAQDAKSTVRLQRDAEGNFGYVYTADASQVADAEQKLADAQNNLYNIGLEGANGYQQKYAETLQESQDAITELTQMWMNGEIASEEEFNRRKQEITEYYGEKLKQYSELHTIALSADSRVLTDAWSSDFIERTASVEEWKNSVDGYFEGAAGSMATWAQVTKEVLADSGLNDMDKALGEVDTKSKALLTTLLGEDGESGVVGAMMSEVEAAGKVSEAHITIQNEIDKTIGYYEDLLTAINNAHTAMTTPVDPAIPTEDQKKEEEEKQEEDKPEDKPEGPTWEKVYGAYRRINNGAWGNGLNNCISAGQAEGYTEEEIRKAQQLINKVYGGMSLSAAKTALGFDTGGYTGDWAGSYGKLAMLHKKELVLKEGDTENFLASMELLERILSIIDLQSANAQLGGMLSSPSYGNHATETTVEQNVHIEASFPGVSDRNELQEAFTNLINQASQYANRK